MGQIKHNVMKLEFQASNDEDQKVENIKDNAAYIRKSDGHLPGLYYLVSWKGYPKKKNTWESISIVQHLWKLVRTFYIENPDKLTTISCPVNTTSPIVKPTFKPTITASQQKRSQFTKATKIAKFVKKS